MAIRSNDRENKFSGPDSYSFEFFKKYWNLVGFDLCDAVEHFFETGSFSNGCNSSFVALIPNITDAKFVNDFRPISLIGSVYKVVAKVLANRLALVISDLISDTQSAFVANRQILDGPFILNELLHWCKRKKKQVMFFKVDFVKAYDSARWDYLLNVLEAFGFGLKINIQKSQVLGVGVPSNIVTQAASSIGCGVLHKQFRYLGVMVGECMSRHNAWASMVDKLRSRLSKWKVKTLSIGGRLTLLKAVLGASPLYNMSVFKVLQHYYSSSMASSSGTTKTMSNTSNAKTPPPSIKTGARSKTPVSRRSVTPNSRSHTRQTDDDAESGRVRVAVRLRPKNADDLISDADYFDCVELQPELKRLKLKKNNWSSESYRFDEVFTEAASQMRVYEAVAKPVVEGVLNGYNGTIMAYGQTGTGKTFTLGKLGKDDASERGIMVRALEDIISGASQAYDSVEISYLQIYMESVQDLLAPEKVNIPIVEDPKNGEVSVPGAAVVKIQNVDHFLHLLQIGEANRHAANTKMNTESSRSHAILMVSFRRSVQDKEENNTSSQGKDNRSAIVGGHVIPTVRKSKLL
nr:armadillo repeat-containing kinesin-like protein 1 [Tanacetum cinerariifolium]